MLVPLYRQLRVRTYKVVIEIERGNSQVELARKTHGRPLQSCWYCPLEVVRLWESQTNTNLNLHQLEWTPSLSVTLQLRRQLRGDGDMHERTKAVFAAIV